MAIVALVAAGWVVYVLARQQITPLRLQNAKSSAASFVSAIVSGDAGTQDDIYGRQLTWQQRRWLRAQLPERAFALDPQSFSGVFWNPDGTDSAGRERCRVDVYSSADRSFAVVVYLTRYGPFGDWRATGISTDYAPK